MLLMDLFKHSPSNYLARIFGCAFLSFSGYSANAALVELSDFGADAATIDFELPSTALPNIPGVSFQEDFGSAATVPGWIASSTTFTRQFFGTAAMGNNMGAGGFSDMAINFLNPVYGVGGWIGHLSSEPHLMPEKITFSIFGINGLLDEVEVLLPGYGETPVFVGLGSTERIARVEWRNGNTGFFGVDNIIYGSVNVIPLPAAVWLFGSGLALLGWMKHRKAA